MSRSILYKEGFYKPIDILGLGFQTYEVKLKNVLDNISVSQKYIEMIKISLKIMAEKYPDFIIR